MSKNDGGPAFPATVKKVGPGTIAPSVYEVKEEGMSLRDYFAAASLMGYRANPKTVGVVPEIVAEWAMSDADAMIAERSKE